MPTAKSASFEERKAQFRQAFLAQLPERLRHIRAHLQKLAAGDEPLELLKTLHLLFHTLKGSAASFGFIPLSALAHAAEQALRETLDREGAPSAALLATLERVLVALEALSTDHEPPLAPRQAVDFQHSGEFAPDPANPSARNHKRIYLCDDDPAQTQHLSAQLTCFGYQVTPFTDLMRLREAILAERPEAVVMDVMFPEGNFAGPQALAALNAELGDVLPSIFISSRDDFAARLQAVKAGGRAYCRKPVKTNELVEFLDLITRRNAPDPFNILVVDDEPDVARYHCLVLEEAGMVTQAATAPEKVLTILRQFNADLVLMDLYMPDCSGPELARLLRQIPGYVSLPIIYVSAETNIDRQFKALEVGADGFFTKPIHPRQLVAEVRLRAERMRILRSLMVRDSLTGLFNHNTITHYLEISASTARRQDSPFCLAMIDVDHFKKINDTYGHLTGDQVLVALSRGLRLSLRDSDLIGRYGGEEFAIVLTGVNLEQARTLLDTLRQNFASIMFFAGEHRFHCTFSGGVAAFPEFLTANALIEAADLALYRAKNAGRNRIEIARSADAREPDPGEVHHES